jgi:hypothetical protein
MSVIHAETALIAGFAVALSAPVSWADVDRSAKPYNLVWLALSSPGYTGRHELKGQVVPFGNETACERALPGIEIQVKAALHQRGSTGGGFDKLMSINCRPAMPDTPSNSFDFDANGNPIN